MALRGTISNANTSGSTTGITLSMTSGWTGSPPQAGDWIILEMVADITSGTFTVTGSTFSAITSVANMNITGGEGTLTFGALARKCDGTEGTITIKVAATSHFYSVTARAYSGRASSPFVVTPATTGPVAQATGPITASITGLTANAGDDLVLLVGGGQASSTSDTFSFTQPTGYSNKVLEQAAATSFAPIQESADNVNVAAGATGTLSATLNNTSGVQFGYGAYLISLANGTPPSPALVQSTTGVGSANVVTATLSGVTAGNCVIAVLSYYENGPTNNTVAPTPTDTNGTFVVAAAPTPAFMAPAGIGSVGVAVWYVANATAGTHAVTQTNSAGPTYELHLTLLEVSNLGATPAIAAAANIFVSSGALAPVPLILPSGIMNQPAAFIVGVSAVASSTGVANAGMTTPSGYTNVNSGSNTSTDIAYEHGYQVPSVGGPFQAQWAWSDNTTSGAQAMLVGFGNSGLFSTNTGTPLGSLPAVEVHYR